MQEQLASMFGGMGSMDGMGGMGGAGGGMGGEGMPDFQKMMAQMMGVDAGGPQQNLLGDLDDPAGLGGAPGPNPFAGMPGMGEGGMPDFSALGGLGGLGGMGGMPGMPGMGGPRKSKVDKYFPLVHALSIFVLALFTVLWWEPTLRLTRYGRLGGLDLAWADRWGGLAGKRGVLKGLKDDVLGGVEVLVRCQPRRAFASYHQY